MSTATLSREVLLDRLVERETQVTNLRRENAALEGVIADLDGKLKHALKALFGPSSERTRPTGDAGQQDLFATPVQQEPAAAGSAATAAPASVAETETITYTRPKRGGGRTPVPRELPVIEQVIAVPADQRSGPHGEELVCTGYETSERLHLVPEQLVRLVIKREKLGLKDTRETVVVAPTLRALIPKGKATDAFVHEIIVRKYLLGLPLYRQAADFASRGVTLSDSFLGDCVRQAAAVYAPVHAAIRTQVLANPLVHADETTLRQLTGAVGAITGYLWAWLAGCQVYFHYATGRGQCEVRTVLGLDKDGRWPAGSQVRHLMCDAYVGYDPAFVASDPERPPPQRLGCWAHVRRKFVDHADTDRNAAEAVTRINAVYRVDRDARRESEKRGLDKAASNALTYERRQATSKPLLADLQPFLTALRPLYTPSSGMATALSYALDRWADLLRYLDDGSLPMDNNAAERAMRRPVIGRKNFLFVGSEDGGAWAACFFSIIESCRLLDLDPRRYFAHVTPLLTAGDPIDHATLTPLAVRDRLSATA